MLPRDTIISEKEPMFMNDKGETYIKDKDGKI